MYTAVLRAPYAPINSSKYLCFERSLLYRFPLQFIQNDRRAPCKSAYHPNN
ncbi:MAG: hypothetical protein LBJ16_00410 [Holosporaceae bacterium]|nr:hypothetical protein [Holosporaceae bacterium]